MKAIQLKAYGQPPENIGVVEINDIGTIKNDEVVIDVLYSPVNPSDLLLMRGTYPILPELPSVIGGEGVGRVASVGSSVSTVKPGDIVAIPFGTFAWSARVVAKAADLIILPAIAVAKSKGIKTLGIVRRKEAVDIALKAGADVVLIDDENVVGEAKKATNNAEIKLGLDAVGGKATNTLAQILGNEGYLVSYAMMSREPINVSQIGLIFRRIQIHGFFMYLPYYIPKLKNAILQSLRLLEQGKLNIPVAEIYPPESVKEAIQHTINGGKVLLQFNA